MKGKKEVLQRAEMRMLKWMCYVKVQDRVTNKELRETMNRLYSLGTTAKHVAMVLAKRRH